MRKVCSFETVHALSKSMATEKDSITSKNNPVVVKCMEYKGNLYQSSNNLPILSILPKLKSPLMVHWRMP